MNNNGKDNLVLQKKYYKKRQAFSLIELIAVLIFLGVVAILAATGAFNKHDEYQNQTPYVENTTDNNGDYGTGNEGETINEDPAAANEDVPVSENEDESVTENEDES